VGRSQRSLQAEICEHSWSGKERGDLDCPSFIFFEGGGNGGEEGEFGELFVGAFVGPDAQEAEFVAVLEPERDLLDGGLFEVVGQGGTRRG